MFFFPFADENPTTKKPIISIIDMLGLKSNSRIGKPEQQILTQMKAMYDVKFIE